MQGSGTSRLAVSLQFAVALLVLSGCGSSSDARPAQLDAGIDAGEFVGADASCAQGHPGCATVSGDAEAGPMSDAPGGAESGGAEAGATDAATDGGTQDAGPPLGKTGSSWYVAKGAPGTRTSSCTAAGTTWANAWGEMDQINWSCVQPGDTVWLAGGTYTHGFAVGASGTASKPIYVARVLSTDTVATGAAGWSGAFDSQVLVTNTAANNAGANCNTGDVLCFDRSTLGNYTYWDGRVDGGIKLQTSNIAGLSPTNNTAIGQAAADIGTGSGAGGTGSNHDITFDGVDFAGPAGATVYTHLSYDAAVQVLNVTGNVLFTNVGFTGVTRTSTSPARAGSSSITASSTTTSRAAGARATATRCSTRATRPSPFATASGGTGTSRGSWSGRRAARSTSTATCSTTPTTPATRA